MEVKEKVKSHRDGVDYFKELPFYNRYIKKPRVKRLKNIDLLSELPLYEELNVIKTNHAFRGYATSYKVKLFEKKDPIEQLEGSKSSIKDLLSDLLDETKGFKYHVTQKVLLKKIQVKCRNLICSNLFLFNSSDNLVSKMLFKEFCAELIID